MSHPPGYSNYPLGPDGCSSSSSLSTTAACLSCSSSSSSSSTISPVLPLSPSSLASSYNLSPLPPSPPRTIAALPLPASLLHPGLNTPAVPSSPFMLAPHSRHRSFSDISDELGGVRVVGSALCAIDVGGTLAKIVYVVDSSEQGEVEEERTDENEAKRNGGDETEQEEGAEGPRSGRKLAAGATNRREGYDVESDTSPTTPGKTPSLNIKLDGGRTLCFTYFKTVRIGDVIDFIKANDLLSMSSLRSSHLSCLLSSPSSSSSRIPPAATVVASPTLFLLPDLATPVKPSIGSPSLISTLSSVPTPTAGPGGTAVGLMGRKLPEDDVGCARVSSGDGSSENMCVLGVTGGGAYKYAKELEEKLSVVVNRQDEMRSIMRGLCYLLEYTTSVFKFDLNLKQRIPVNTHEAPLFPFLVVNIGSGVSILKAEGPENFVRVTGTCIGGGTVLGLANLLFGAHSFDEVVKLADSGTGCLDLTVADLLGDTAGSISLPDDTLACSFGRVYCEHLKGRGKDLRKEDLARSLIHMVSYNIGYLAYLVGTTHAVRRLIFAGKYINNSAVIMESITEGVHFYTKHYKFLAKGRWSTQTRRTAPSGSKLRPSQATQTPRDHQASQSAHITRPQVRCSQSVSRRLGGMPCLPEDSPTTVGWERSVSDTVSASTSGRPGPLAMPFLNHPPPAAATTANGQQCGRSPPYPHHICLRPCLDSPLTSPCSDFSLTSSPLSVALGTSAPLPPAEISPAFLNTDPSSPAPPAYRVSGCRGQMPEATLDRCLSWFHGAESPAHSGRLFTHPLDAPVCSSLTVTRETSSNCTQSADELAESNDEYSPIEGSTTAADTSSSVGAQTAERSVNDELFEVLFVRHDGYLGALGSLLSTSYVQA
eukprot:GHVS01031767.1.p1 GENE.GHVS01031767.1~~GHVS01031767.1.p1  ORF type:complete len:879 (-),score=118.95 GHVS01031767.1:87-2723(-)